MSEKRPPEATPFPPRGRQKVQFWPDDAEQHNAPPHNEPRPASAMPKVTGRHPCDVSFATIEEARAWGLGFDAGRATAAPTGFDDPTFKALSDECTRLRDVIRTGGAMYRAERAIMGIPGGEDRSGSAQPLAIGTKVRTLFTANRQASGN